jgi:hypothetical protein
MTKQLLCQLFNLPKKRGFPKISPAFLAKRLILTGYNCPYSVGFCRLSKKRQISAVEKLTLSSFPHERKNLRE